MIEGTAHDTTVSYFRTTLDPLDLYRIDNIINHGADDDVSTPAAALATHLRGVNPALYWHTRAGRTVAEQATCEAAYNLGLAGGLDEEAAGSFFFFDAVVADSSTTTPVIIANLRYDHQLQGEPFSRFLQVQPEGDDPMCAVYATTLAVDPVSNDDVYLFGDAVTTFVDDTTAHTLATWDEPVEYAHLRTYFNVMTDPRRSIRARNTAVDVPAGFRRVSWEDTSWKSRHRRSLGYSVLDCVAFDDDDNDTCPAICSSILQGQGFAPLVEVAVA